MWTSIGDLHDVALEQAAGVGIGQHDRADIRTELGFQRGDIDAAVRRGLHFVHREACEGRGGRIGAMRGFGNQHARALLAARQDGGADGQQPAQLAMRARFGGHRHGRHRGQAWSASASIRRSAPSAPCAVDCGANGCRSPKPGRRAIFSLRRGLCFMVQEPSG